MRRCSAVATMSSTSSTPERAASSITCSRIGWRTSGVRMGGRGIEMSSIAIVSFMPANSSSGSGFESPTGFNSAWRTAAGTSRMPGSASGGYTTRVPSGNFCMR